MNSEGRVAIRGVGLEILEDKPIACREGCAEYLLICRGGRVSEEAQHNHVIPPVAINIGHPGTSAARTRNPSTEAMVSRSGRDGCHMAGRARAARSPGWPRCPTGWSSAARFRSRPPWAPAPNVAGGGAEPDFTRP